MGLPRTSFGFTGEQTDPTGLIYLRARYYNPQFGSFLSRDPVFGVAGVSMSYNGYSYANANPVMYRDPSGRFAFLGIAITWALVGHILASVAIGAATGYVGTRAIDAGIQQITTGRIDWDRNAAAGLEGGVMGAIMGPFGLALNGLRTAGMSAKALFALGVSIDVGIGTAWDYSVHGGTFGEAFVTNLVGGLAGELGGMAVEGLLKAGKRGLSALDNAAWVRRLRNSSADAAMLRLERMPDVDNSAWVVQQRATRNANIASGVDPLPQAVGQCSFSADTSVATENGQKPISEIKPDDKVLAYNEKTGQTESKAVTAVHEHDDKEIVYLTLDGERIETTPEHPFYTQEHGWVAAGDLKVDERIRKADGTYGKVEKISREQRQQKMYNLTVDTGHTFFVGDGKWLV